MTLWHFAAGMVVTACILGPTAWGARRACRRWFGAQGPSALLVEIVGTLAQVYAVALSLGAIGWFRRWPVALGCTVVGACLTLATRRKDDDPLPLRRNRESMPQTATYLAVLAVVVVTAQYLARTLVSLQRGIYDNDTLWYHGPVAARFVQDGWTTRLYFEGGERVVTYYPANGELAAAMLMLPFHGDALLPLLNLGWLALALLAGWCIGRRHGRGPVGVAAVAATLSLPIVAVREAGTVGNDLPAVALLLAATALLAEAEWRPPWLALSGVAAGLAFGVKLSAVPPVLVMAVALAVVAPNRQRLRSGCAWLTGFAGPAVYWPIRDWVRTGNPFPWWSLHLGPVHLSAVPSGAPGPDTSVLHYLGRPSMWSGVFAPGLKLAFGPGWPLLLALTALGGLSVLIAGRSAVDRAVGAVGLVGLGLYTSIPGSVVLPAPVALLTFADTVRYAVPALAVVLVALSASRQLHKPIPATAVTALLAALVVLDQFPRRTEPGTPPTLLPATDVLLGFVIAVCITAVAVLWKTWRQSPPGFGGVGVAGLVLLCAVEASPFHPYSATGHAAPISTSVFSWGREIRHARIAVSGSWGQFPLFGPTLSNRVQYVSITGPNGTFQDATTCGAWRRAVDGGDYTYLVMFRPPPFIAVGRGTTKEAWVSSDRDAILLARYPDVDVWKLRGPLDPSRCGSL